MIILKMFAHIFDNLKFFLKMAILFNLSFISTSYLLLNYLEGNDVLLLILIAFLVFSYGFFMFHCYFPIKKLCLSIFCLYKKGAKPNKSCVECNYCASCVNCNRCFALFGWRDVDNFDSYDLINYLSFIYNKNEDVMSLIPSFKSGGSWSIRLLKYDEKIFSELIKSDKQVRELLPKSVVDSLRSRSKTKRVNPYHKH